MGVADIHPIGRVLPGTWGIFTKPVGGGGVGWGEMGVADISQIGRGIPGTWSIFPNRNEEDIPERVPK